MTDREKLMRQIIAYRFSLLELHIYLDTHPGDCTAAEKMEELRRTAADLTAKYESAYGPICETPKTANRWAWISDPWPWDFREGDK